LACSAVNALMQLIEAPRRPLPNYVFRPKLRAGRSTAPPPPARVSN
jgi:hypothetical protein